MDKYLVPEFKIKASSLTILKQMHITNIHIIFMIVILDGFQSKELKEIKMNIL